MSSARRYPPFPFLDSATGAGYDGTETIEPSPGRPVRRSPGKALLETETTAMKKRALVSLCIASLLLLSSCSKGAEVLPSPSLMPSSTPQISLPPTPTPSPEPSPLPVGPANPLTGLPLESEEEVAARPVAIMLNNLREALPQQGQSQADIIYECLEEGGITRMLGLYQSVKGVGTVGSIRSARTYYLQMALGHDAIFIHAGGSDVAGVEDAYGKIREWGVTSLDGVRGPYMSTKTEGGLMWRDPSRKKANGTVHSVVTTGTKMTSLLPTLGIRLDHKEGWTYEMAFADDGTPADGINATAIKAVYSQYKAGVFRYDTQQGLYLVEEYGKPYIDGNTGEQVGVTNVVVLQAHRGYTGASYGHVTIDLSSGGTGYYACGGKAIEIRWTKDYPDGQFRYTDAAGNPVQFGRGKTYVNIIPTDQTIEIE